MLAALASAAPSFLRPAVARPGRASRVFCDGLMTCTFHPPAAKMMAMSPPMMPPPMMAAWDCRAGMIRLAGRSIGARCAPLRFSAGLFHHAPHGVAGDAAGKVAAGAIGVQHREADLVAAQIEVTQLPRFAVEPGRAVDLLELLAQRDFVLLRSVARTVPAPGALDRRR